jgi:hypothetical protein
MGLHHIPAQTAMSPARKDVTTTHLQGARLVTARIVWVGLVVLIFVAYVSSLPDYFAQLQRVCVHAPCAYGQISLSAYPNRESKGTAYQIVKREWEGLQVSLRTTITPRS